jgi:Spy/CpxP family protein refolding chaperone
MAQIEKIGKLRIEQAKLAMQRVILIRDHLTPAQRTKLNTMLEEDQIKWRAAREESARKRETTPEAGQKK